MISFPSALNRAGNNARVSNDEDVHHIGSANSVLFDVSRIKAYNFNLNSEVKSELLQPENMNISQFFRYTSMRHVPPPHQDITIQGSRALNMQELAYWATGNMNTAEGLFSNNDPTNTKSTATTYSASYYTEINRKNATTEGFRTQIFYEDPNKLPAGLIQSMNRYTHVYRVPVNSVLNLGSQRLDESKKAIYVKEEEGKKGKQKSVNNANIYVNYSQTPVVSSIFNPIYMIQVMGMSENVPLLSNVYDINQSIAIEYQKPMSAQEAKNRDGLRYTKRLNDLGGNEEQIGKKFDRTTSEVKHINPLNGIVDTNLSNCTMRELVRKSHKHSSILGQARYKYADFMFCKDLGKVSNNHLITLRKFAHPVGDNIFRTSSPKFRTTKPGDAPDWDTEGDVGRLISWFGTDDNKLEDIAKYSVGASWKELESSIQALGENADAANKNEAEINAAEGGMGGAVTSNVDVTTGIETITPDVPKMSLFTQKLIYAPMGVNLVTETTRNREELIAGARSTYGSIAYGSDKNKIYTPKNTIQATHVYEGKLTFEQEFTLNFSYKLRAYDNINPKSAFLDLLGNILEVTYRRGKFWGGARSAQGPKEPAGGGSPGHGSPSGGGGHGGGAGPAKNENMVKDNFDRLEGFAKGLASGAINWQDIMASISDYINKISDTAKEMAQQIKDGWNANGFLGLVGATILVFRDALALAADGNGPDPAANSGSGAGGHPGGTGGPSRGAGSAMSKQAGKAAVYAMDSLLKGDSVGLWHLTVGNPKNPIFVCGNLILTKATITHSGPLGIDDFPTDLKVSCTLKHGRARDIIEISKMYTKGVSTLYNTVDRNLLSDFFKVAGSEVENIQQKDRAVQEVVTAYEKTRTELLAANSDDIKKMVKEAAKKEWEDQHQKDIDAAEAAGNSKDKERLEKEKWSESKLDSTDAWKTYQGKMDSMKDTLKELQGQIEGFKAGGADILKDARKDGINHDGNDVYYFSTASSRYKVGMFDLDIYNDDEFENETNKEYINSQKALRYETLGQDRDYIGRLVIDEIS